MNPAIFLLVLLFIPSMAFAEDEGLGMSELIDDVANQGDEVVKQLVNDTDIDGNPLGTTGDEINDVSDHAFGTLKEGKDFFFSFHELMQSIIFAGSPIDLDTTLVLIVSAGVALLFVMYMLKGVWKHMAIFGGIMVAIIAFFLVMGTNPEF